MENFPRFAPAHCWLLLLLFIAAAPQFAFAAETNLATNTISSPVTNYNPDTERQLTHATYIHTHRRACC